MERGKNISTWLTATEYAIFKSYRKILFDGKFIDQDSDYATLRFILVNLFKQINHLFEEAERIIKERDKQIK